MAIHGKSYPKQRAQPWMKLQTNCCLQCCLLQKAVDREKKVWLNCQLTKLVRILFKGRKCLDVSIKIPRWANLGKSVMSDALIKNYENKEKEDVISTFFLVRYCSKHGKKIPACILLTEWHIYLFIHNFPVCPYAALEALADTQK